MSKKPEQEVGFSLAEYSEFDVDEDETNIPVPESIVRYKTRMSENSKCSVFDQPEEEEVTYIVSGRGRGGRNVYIAPGGKVMGQVVTEELDNKWTEDMQTAIRLCSGLHHSNEMIVNFIKSKQTDENSKDSNSGIPEITFDKLSVSSRNSTPKSNPESEVAVCTSDKENDKNQNISINETKRCSTDNIKTENVDTSPKKSTGAIPKKPLPLSQLLKKSKQKSTKMNNNSLEKISSNLSPNAEPFIPKSNSSTISDSQSSHSEDYRMDYLSWRNRDFNLSSKNRDSDYLSWRNRDYIDEGTTSDDSLSFRKRQQPAFHWRPPSGLSKEKILDIFSPEEFPALK